MLPSGGALIGMMRGPCSLWTSPSGKLATVLQFASIQEKCPPLYYPNSACLDLALVCILLLNRPVLVRKDFAQGALKSKLQCNPAKTA